MAPVSKPRRSDVPISDGPKDSTLGRMDRSKGVSRIPAAHPLTGTMSDTFAASLTSEPEPLVAPFSRLRGAGGPEREGFGSLAVVGATDRLAPFNPAILAVRWSSTVACFALGAGAFIQQDLRIVPWMIAILANTFIRTLSPLVYDGSTRNLINLLVEIGLHVLALTSTGFWDSPLVFSLVNAIILAGFARGFAFAGRIAAASGIAVSLPYLSESDYSWTAITRAAQWLVVLGLVAIVAGYARRISGEASRQHTIALDRLNRLSDANSLLFNLHRIAQTMPVSLNLDEVLTSTIVRLRTLVDFDAACILVIDETDGSWVVARRQAMRIGQLLGGDELPAPARSAIDRLVVDLRPDLDLSGPGFNIGSMCGIYAPMRARGALIGLLAIESNASGRFDERDRQVLESYVEPVALAIDNARWFARLRTVGADEERTRIARDLHDRIGQSLAYLGFEIDRVISHDLEDLPVTDELEQLRTDLRGVTSEVRETLYDLRTDVATGKDFVDTLEEFARRVTERSEITIELDCEASFRLPILQEREVWRIAQEALVNVERHAEADRVDVRWRCEPGYACLEVIDDGCGFAVGKTGRQDSYGILGMRERASSIGASLELTSKPGEGTTLRCILAQA